MITSEKGKDFIKSWEALKLQSYQDVAGVWTVGYGHTLTARPNQNITEEQANHLFLQDLAGAESDVNIYVADYITISQGMFDALVSLVYNLGGFNIFLKEYNNGYDKGSTLYNELLNGNFGAAADRFTDFVNAGGVFWQGLENRRLKEKEMFLKGFKKKSSLTF